MRVRADAQALLHLALDGLAGRQHRLEVQARQRLERIQPLRGKQAAGGHFHRAVHAPQRQQFFLEQDARGEQREQLAVRLDVLQRRVGQAVFLRPATGGRPPRSVAPFWPLARLAAPGSWRRSPTVAWPQPSCPATASGRSPVMPLSLIALPQTCKALQQAIEGGQGFLPHREHLAQIGLGFLQLGLLGLAACSYFAIAAFSSAFGALASTARCSAVVSGLVWPKMLERF